MKFTFTIQQVAERTGVSKEAAYGLVTFLKAKGLATEAGKIPQPAGKKGQGQNLYEMDSDVASRTLGAMFAGG